MLILICFFFHWANCCLRASLARWCIFTPKFGIVIYARVPLNRRNVPLALSAVVYSLNAPHRLATTATTKNDKIKFNDHQVFIIRKFSGRTDRFCSSRRTVETYSHSFQNSVISPRFLKSASILEGGALCNFLTFSPRNPHHVNSDLRTMGSVPVSIFRRRHGQNTSFSNTPIDSM